MSWWTNQSTSCGGRRPPESPSSSTCRSPWGTSRTCLQQQFKGKSRIGNYGDKIMEGDYHVGQILDTLKELGIDDNTIVVFASDNGPQGETAREYGNQGTPDMGNSGPFRGELGEVTEGAIRTAAIIRWPGKVKPNTTIVRDVLDHGLSANLRPHHRRHGADRSGD